MKHKKEKKHSEKKEHKKMPESSHAKMAKIIKHAARGK